MFLLPVSRELTFHVVTKLQIRLTYSPSLNCERLIEPLFFNQYFMAIDLQMNTEKISAPYQAFLTIVLTHRNKNDMLTNEYCIYEKFT